MTTMTLADLADRRAGLAERIERLQQEKCLVDAEIFKLTNEQPGNYDAGEYTLQVKAGARRLDEKRFAERFDVTQYPQFYKAVPDLAAIKDMFSPADLERFQVQNKPSINVR